MTNEPKPASPLPWRIDADRPDIGGFIAKAADDTTVLYSRVLPCAANASYVEKTHQNYRFIVAACNAHPALRARVAELEAENAKLKAALERISEWTIYDPCTPTTYDAETAAELMREMRDIASTALTPKEPHVQGT